MKKIIAITIAALLALGVGAGCKKEEQKPATAPVKPPQTTAAPAPAQQPPAGAPAAPATAPAKPSTAPAPKTVTAPKKPGETTAATAPGAAKPVTPVTPATAADPAETIYSYNSIREDGKPKRNPFTPITVNPITPTVQYEITQLGVNGVILHGIKRASVVTPNCITTFVKVGEMIGVHDGVIVDITLEGVLVKETFVDEYGRIQEYERMIENRPFGCQ